MTKQKKFIKNFYNRKEFTTMKNIYKITPDFFTKHADKNAEQIRDAKAEFYGEKDFRHNKFWNGANGCAFELSCHSSRAKSTKIGKGKNNDITVYIDIGGGYCRAERAECKTNGGRIDSILAAVERGNDFIVIYELSVMNSTTGNNLIHIPARYCLASKFIEILKECNAIKAIRKNGEIDGYGIQPSNRQLWKELERLPRYETDTFLTI